MQRETKKINALLYFAGYFKFFIVTKNVTNDDEIQPRFIYF